MLHYTCYCLGILQLKILRIRDQRSHHITNTWSRSHHSYSAVYVCVIVCVCLQTYAHDIYERAHIWNLLAFDSCSAVAGWHTSTEPKVNVFIRWIKKIRAHTQRGLEEFTDAVAAIVAIAGGDIDVAVVVLLLLLLFRIARLMRTSHQLICDDQLCSCVPKVTMAFNTQYWLSCTVNISTYWFCARVFLIRVLAHRHGITSFNVHHILTHQICATHLFMRQQQYCAFCSTFIQVLSAHTRTNCEYIFNILN